MTSRQAFVPTGAIQHAVVGREEEILAALSICWTGGSNHIHCPYPTHTDNHPSWRRDAAIRCAFCTCTKSDSIFDVVCKMKEVSFEAAKIIVTEIIGRPDLIEAPKERRFCRSDAASLLNPDPDNRNDELVWVYLGHRLGIEPAMVPRPTTEVVGVNSLPYFDAPHARGRKRVFVGDFLAAIFETVDREDRRHAHRIYLGGVGKAEIGVTASGEQREPKKSAKKSETKTLLVVR
jgi:hypothetical protein